MLDRAAGLFGREKCTQNEEGRPKIVLVKLSKNFVINFSFLKESLFNESSYFLLCIYTNRIFGKN